MCVQDPDAAFGLSGDVVRFIKKGTWASMALLVSKKKNTRKHVLFFFFARHLCYAERGEKFSTPVS